MEPDQQSVTFAPPPDLERPKPSKISKSKKLFLIVLALVILAVIAAAVWLLVSKKKNTSTSDAQKTQSSQSNPSSTSTAAKTADKIFYLYREKSTNAYTLYSRPAVGGERTNITTLAKTAFPQLQDSNASGYLYTVDGQLWYGKNDGTIPKKLVEISGTMPGITGAKFYDEGNKALYSALGDSDHPSLRSVSLAGGDSRTLYTSTKNGAALIMTHFNGKDRVDVRPNCWFCDGFTSPTAGFVVDLGTGKEIDATPLADITPQALGDFYFFDDASTFYYLKTTEDKSTKTRGGLGSVADYYIGAPFTLLLRKISDGSEKTVLSGLGEKKLAYGEAAFYYRSFGHTLESSPRIYFTFGNKLYVLTGDKASLLYEVDSPNIISKVLYLDDKTAVVALRDGASLTTTDLPVYSLDLSSKKATKIMTATESDTIFLGVSLK